MEPFKTQMDAIRWRTPCHCDSYLWVFLSLFFSFQVQVPKSQSGWQKKHPVCLVWGWIR